jgi:hypothetical protein
MYIHVHIVFPYIFLYILGKNMFMQCILQVHTSNVQIHVFMHIYWKDKKLARWRIEPRISLSVSSRLNHYCSSVYANHYPVIV